MQEPPAPLATPMDVVERQGTPPPVSVEGAYGRD